MFDEILKKIKEYDTIIIHRHERPDGDCIGSQIGLKEIIKTSYPEKHVYAVGEHTIENLNFLGHLDVISDDIYINALVIVVDTSTVERVCDKRFTQGRYLIKIDHHNDSPAYADLEYIDSNIPACGAIITQFYISHQNELKMNTLAANALLTAIISDTGRFQYRGVNSLIFRSTATLLDQGADIQYIYSNLYLRNKNELDLEAHIYNNIKMTQHGVASIDITIELRKAFNVPDEQAAELITSLSTIKGSLIWVAFIEQPDGSTRVRLRSRFVPINQIGAMYRGGGHLQAAGATIYNEKEHEEILEKLDNLLAMYKLEHPECM